ncbi:barstar family protein (plasmid) [Deinococcus taeanensis]|uniref:barstar family protein n=1 Tax=Deinococcus taeanensis TaxID=2737050 RepID=UPI001CDCEDCA|nr:barstar family protein [Deinococcus taeanensis]UBV44103.1 barstar family protein [Deinococcus taeanensis]
MAEITLDTRRIRSLDEFHEESARAFGFPDFYGSNLSAWIDCLTYLDENDGMRNFVLNPDEMLHVLLPDFEVLAAIAPEVVQNLLSGVAAVNERFLAQGRRPRLSLVPC